MPDSITPHVSPSLREKFLEDGFLMPVDIFTTEEITAHRRELERLEKRLSSINVGNKSQLNYPHVLFRFANEMVRNPRLLDVAESILGPDILIWGSTFFIKEPETQSYVSWHQDMKYWGLSDTNGQVSAWIALNDVGQDNGCMQFLPGSHHGEMLDHRDTFSETNILTRGQEADIEIDTGKILHVELAPGQASFHHGKLLHASPPNRSKRRRIGLAVQFIAPHVRQQVAEKDFAMLVRGKDRYGYFELINPPEDDLSPGAVELHHRILTSQNEAMYEGTGQPRS